MLTGRGAGRVRASNPTSSAPVNPANIKAQDERHTAPSTAELLDKARLRAGDTVGSSPAQIAAARFKLLAVAEQFPSVMQDLTRSAVKTHFILPRRRKRTTRTRRRCRTCSEDRPGQMDAFGIASGLVAIHTLAKEQSFLEFVGSRHPDSPFFSGFSKQNGCLRRSGQ